MAHDWYYLNREEELNGLSPFGFKGNEPLDVSKFDKDELKWALNFAHCCGEPIQTINKKHSSYGLKHLAERRTRILTEHNKKNVNYISNGALILAMVDAGFRFKREESSPNVFFNVSERALKRLFKQYNRL